MSKRTNYNAYMNKYMLERYHRRRNNIISNLGGQCIKCGSVNDLEIDHIDPTKKKFNLAKIFLHAVTKLEGELSKCQILCKQCHQDKSIVDGGFNKVKNTNTHGTLSSYRYCKCKACRKAKSDYTKEHRKVGSRKS